jgi:RecA/RadA recombinase
MATRRKVVVAEGATKAPRAKLDPEAILPRSRAKLEGRKDQASDYFAGDKPGIEFVSSGCATLDAVLGGGWALGRVANIVGDKSAGKTLLAIEACANFHRQYPDGKIRYNEAEAAFDESYAAALGMPVHVVDFAGRPVDPKDEEKHAELSAIMADRLVDDRVKEKTAVQIKRLENKGVGKASNTVEALHDDIVFTLDSNRGKPILYIIDSLDALSDEAEQGREIGDSSYGGSKPKKMGEMFRRLVERMEGQRMLLIVISQLRDKLNVTFGEKQTRSGGRALDFYASHVVWLAEVGKIKKTVQKVDRIIGVDVRARCKKNKVGLPFRECSYPILFGYGIDDLTANVEWLISVGKDERLADIDMSKAGYAIRINKLRNEGGDEVRQIRAKLNALVVEEWANIERNFLPLSRKY